MRNWVFIVFLMVSAGVNASEVYQCKYAKAKIVDGTLGALSFPVPAKVEVIGKSIKTFRPDGSFIISTPLNTEKGDLLMADDGSKVYAATKDKTSFAFSDKIARTTEQWDKCTSLMDVQNADVWIVINKKDEMTDEVKASTSISSKENPSVSMIFSCESGNKNISMAVLAVDEIITDELITVRIDKKKAQNLHVTVVRTPNGSAAFTDVSNAFINSMLHATGFLVRYGEYSKGGVTLPFELNGFESAIHKIKSSCNI